MSNVPRPYDESFVAHQMAQMVENKWTTFEIAQWFAKWGYEEGKADQMARKEETNSEIERLKRVADQAIDFAGIQMEGDNWMHSRESSTYRVAETWPDLAEYKRSQAKSE